MVVVVRQLLQLGLLRDGAVDVAGLLDHEPDSGAVDRGGLDEVGNGIERVVVLGLSGDDDRESEQLAVVAVHRVLDVDVHGVEDRRALERAAEQLLINKQIYIYIYIYTQVLCVYIYIYIYRCVCMYVYMYNIV